MCGADRKTRLMPAAAASIERSQRATHGPAQCCAGSEWPFDPVSPHSVLVCPRVQLQVVQGGLPGGWGPAEIAHGRPAALCRRPPADRVWAAASTCVTECGMLVWPSSQVTRSGVAASRMTRAGGQAKMWQDTRDVTNNPGAITDSDHVDQPSMMLLPACLCSGHSLCPKTWTCTKAMIWLHLRRCHLSGCAGPLARGSSGCTASA
jgi:hypothetical protein